MWAIRRRALRAKGTARVKAPGSADGVMCAPRERSHTILRFLTLLGITELPSLRRGPRAEARF